MIKSLATVNVITLGCSKNLVDSERVLRMLSDAGFNAVHESEEKTDLVVINTCGFIGDAKEESINTIMERNLCNGMSFGKISSGITE